MSRFANVLLTIAAAVFLGGCGTLKFERSRLQGDRLQNPTHGRGVYYRIPEGYAQLNPWSPVPPKPENEKFEAMLRGIVAKNDQYTFEDGFRESLLFRNGDRYLMLIHVSLNLPITLRRVDHRQLGVIFGGLATETCRYFDVPPREFDYTNLSVCGQPAIFYKLFRPRHATLPNQEWRGVGCTVIGDVKDVTTVFAFARAEEVEAAQIDLNRLIAGFRYGSPPSD